MLNKLKNTVIIFVLLGMSLANSRAETPSFALDSESLRKRLVSDNITLSKAFNQVQRAKLEVGMARAKLLPTINLTALLPALANPTFLLGSVAFIFPFLIPSNWAVLKQQKELFEADKLSYKALQMNVYASALAVYQTYLMDEKIQGILEEEANILENLYRQLQRQSDIVGNISLEELSMARSQWQESLVRVSKMQELLIEELAQLRKMLDLPLGTKLLIAPFSFETSVNENKDPQELADSTLAIAPETQQLKHLIKAAKAGRFSKAMGFLDSATISGNSFGGNASAFSNLRVGVGFNFGADIVMNVRMASNNLEAIKLRQEEQRLEHEAVAEVVLGRLEEIKEQLQLSHGVNQDRLSVYQSQRRQYGLGLLPLQTLLQTQVLLTNSQIDRVRILWQLGMQRTTLYRMGVEGPFAKIEGCRSKDYKNPRGFLGIRWRRSQSLDVLCHSTN